eukprot:TRINITY_DN4993_c0_g1_i1.p1 TRINITY_DN4993_c0_g1~~TRINITY_DN4993_c0_g1_i1.p1  ORF type:complete len:549 (-),score=33.31 TRINITY_DN4993_c0_g1_i1:216-1862(-)
MATPPTRPFLMQRCQPDPWQVANHRIFPDPELVCCHPLQSALGVDVTLMRHSLASGIVGSAEYYDGASLEDDGYSRSSPRTHQGLRPPYDSQAFATNAKATDEVAPRFDERSVRLFFAPVAPEDGVSNVKFRLIVPSLNVSSLSEKSGKSHKSKPDKSKPDEFCLRFRTDPFGADGVRYEAFSAPFRVVSSSEQLQPKFRIRRPLESPKSEEGVAFGGHHDSSGGNKRARGRAEEDDGYYYRISIRETQKLLREVSLDKHGTFADLRAKMQEAIPADVMYQFWHPGMDRMDHNMTVEITVGIMAMWDSEKATVPVETLLQKLLQFYPMQIQVGQNSWKPCTSDQVTIARLGAYDFFRFCQNKKRTKSPLPEVAFATLADFQLFLKFFGEPQRCMVKVLEAYTTKFFHRFLSSDAAKEKLLSGADGSYLIRYSQSRMKDGLFALDVAKAKDDGRLAVESYLLQYDPSMEKFLFDGMYFDLFTDFVQHPKYYPHILSQPVLYTQSLISKDPKYQDDTALVLQMERLRMHHQQEECPPTPFSTAPLDQMSE